MAATTPLYSPPLHPARRLIRALSIPLSYPSIPTPSQHPTDAIVEMELDDLPVRGLPTTAAAAIEELERPQLRRRATTTTTPATSAVYANHKSSWPAVSITREEFDNSRRSSLDSIFSDASSLSQLSSHSEPRARPRTRPTAARNAQRKSEADAIWREFWA